MIITKDLSRHVVLGSDIVRSVLRKNEENRDAIDFWPDDNGTIAGVPKIFRVDGIASRSAIQFS